MNPDLEPTKIIEYLKRNTSIVPKYCDNCGAIYQDHSLQVLGSKQGTVSCRIHCESCSGTHLLTVAIPVNGVGVATRAPMNVDLTSREEFSKFASKGAVAGNEAIESYRLLSEMRDMQDFIRAINGS